MSIRSMACYETMVRSVVNLSPWAIAGGIHRCSVRVLQEQTNKNKRAHRPAVGPGVLNGRSRCLIIPAGAALLGSHLSWTP
jgi:hypothetical protein